MVNKMTLNSDSNEIDKKEDIKDVIDKAVYVPYKEEKKVENNKYNNTTKKKAVRTFSRDVQDLKTGEISQETIIETEDDVDYNWEKAWIINLFLAFQELGSKRVDVALWLMKNKNSENQIVYTQREISEKTGISTKTVNQTIQLLVGCNALRRKNNKGICMWNPDIIAKGNKTKRRRLILEFNQLPEATKTKG